MALIATLSFPAEETNDKQTDEYGGAADGASDNGPSLVDTT